ncbi:EAL and HDOD domain-containing protein [Paraferrimonas sedimenticola]|uniref:Diguanylate cyclase n=1 Tax=Paraferrimonas sedimenticola TaxID=375674 RepID=A0AA37VUA8_9GAMM|nr:HDOD domain-containing protein [Paraferrimonas sedimenticola]GLP95546.1 diguanylate cyclase [Paraferrimonas sedimenticola]
MKIYTARQAIFNRQQRVVAYELLYRDGPENIFPDVDPHEATARLIMRTHLNTGLKKITGGKPALINFPEKALKAGLAEVVPCEQVVIEILETVEPSDAVLEICKKLYRAGYHLALDDFVYEPRWERFLPYVKLIKFDIQRTPLAEVEPLVKRLRESSTLKFLAERVETPEEFAQARRLGFHFFQGYFFCKPELEVHSDLESASAMMVELYREASRDQIIINNMVAVFERDTGLTYRLLRFVNSGTLPNTQDIASIKQAVVYLGDIQLRKLSLLLVSAVCASKKPRELIRLSVLRARFCELVAKLYDPKLAEAAFVVGLLSLLDAILNRPLEQLLQQLPLRQEIVVALTEAERTPLFHILNTVRHYEKGSWYNTGKAARQLMLSYEAVAEAYAEAVDWTETYQVIHS